MIGISSGDNMCNWPRILFKQEFYSTSMFPSLSLVAIKVLIIIIIIIIMFWALFKELWGLLYYELMVVH